MGLGKRRVSARSRHRGGGKESKTDKRIKTANKPQHRQTSGRAAARGLERGHRRPPFPPRPPPLSLANAGAPGFWLCRNTKKQKKTKNTWCEDDIVGVALGATPPHTARQPGCRRRVRIL